MRAERERKIERELEGRRKRKWECVKIWNCERVSLWKVGNIRLMHLSQVRLMVEVFNLRTNELLGQGCSQPICDSSSKVKFELSEYSGEYSDPRIFLGVFWSSKESFLFTCPAKIIPTHPVVSHVFHQKRSTELWSSTQPFPSAAVPRVAARWYFPPQNIYFAHPV